MIKNYNITKYQYNYLKDFLELNENQIKDILYSVFEMAYCCNDTPLKALDTDTLNKYKLWQTYKASKSKTNTKNGLKNKGLKHNDNAKKIKTTKQLKQINEMLSIFYGLYADYVEQQKALNTRKHKKREILYILKPIDKTYIKNLFYDRVQQNKTTYNTYIKKMILLLPTIPKLKKAQMIKHMNNSPYEYMAMINNYTYFDIFKRQNSLYTSEKLY
jgi:hypothetical protein